MPEYLHVRNALCCLTPIGNLEDLTYRAVRVLSEVDLVACEDTRHSQKLLNHYGIKAKTVSYHEHNERDRAEDLIGQLKSGLDVAIVSDAGTPGISDPGFRVVRMALEADLKVVPIPETNSGGSALVALVSLVTNFSLQVFCPIRRTSQPPGGTQESHRPLFFTKRLIGWPHH